MALHEIVLETTEPETEWVRGRPLRKVSPTYRHGLAQRLIAEALGTWAFTERRGRVATEWRFRVMPPGALTRPLIPDVGYLAYATLSENAPLDEVEVPRAAPTIAIEILSPDDRDDDVGDKVATYLAAGTAAVILVDPLREYAIVHDRSSVRHLGTPDCLAHAALPGFALDLGAFFARIRSGR